MIKRSSLCGSNEYKLTKKIAPANSKRVALSQYIPIGTKTKLDPSARGKTEQKYQSSGDVLFHIIKIHTNIQIERIFNFKNEIPELELTINHYISYLNYLRHLLITSCVQINCLNQFYGRSILFHYNSAPDVYII